MALSFDGPNKRITLSSGTTSLSVLDLWSRWVDWLLTSDNSKYLFAFEQIGGNDIDPGAGTAIPIFIFLKSGWKVKPQEADHTLNVVDGILLVDGGGDPFIDTTGDYVVRINYQQPVQAIGFSEGGGTAPSVNEIVTGILGAAIDGIDLKATLKTLLAHAAGEASGGGTNTLKFRDQGDTKDVITAVVDEYGNRSVVIVDAD